jgi:K+/H+ antiporter YhaU regulatory subunit KhtT
VRRRSRHLCPLRPLQRAVELLKHGASETLPPLAEAGFRARTGVTVIAILREPEPISGAQPSDTIERGDTLVTVGKAGQYAQFRRLLSRGDSTGSGKE